MSEGNLYLHSRFLSIVVWSKGLESTIAFCGDCLVSLSQNSSSGNEYDLIILESVKSSDVIEINPGLSINKRGEVILNKAFFLKIIHLV